MKILNTKSFKTGTHIPPVDSAAGCPKRGSRTKGKVTPQMTLFSFVRTGLTGALLC